MEWYERVLKPTEKRTERTYRVQKSVQYGTTKLCSYKLYDIIQFTLSKNIRSDMHSESELFDVDIKTIFRSRRMVR